MNLYCKYKCGEYFLRERRLHSSCRVVALEHGLSCEWAPGCEADPVHSSEWWLFNNFSCPSELWAITLAACQVNPNKNRQKAETICCLASWPLLKYFCSPRVQHWHIFERRMANVIFESWLWTQCSCKCPDCDLKQKSRWDLCLDTAGQYPEHYTFHHLPVLLNYDENTTNLSPRTAVH